MPLAGLAVPTDSPLGIVIGVDDSGDGRAIELKVMDWAKATQDRSALYLTLDDISLFRDALASDPKGTVEAASTGGMMGMLGVMMHGGPEKLAEMLIAAADGVITKLAQATLYDFVLGGIIMSTSMLTLVRRVHTLADEAQVKCPNNLWDTTQQFSEHIGLAGLCSDEKPEYGLSFIMWLKSMAAYVGELDAAVAMQRHMAETRELADAGNLTAEEAVKRGEEIAALTRRAGPLADKVQVTPRRRRGTPVPHIDDATAMHILHNLDGESPHA